MTSHRLTDMCCIFGLIAVSMWTVSGCGYAVGPAHDPCITSVEVVTFKNDSFRRGMEFMLTEAVQKEIQNRTTMRLAKGPGAQTRLTGRIVDFRKNVLGETKNDDPRELQLTLVVEITWEDAHNGQVLAQQSVPLDAGTTALATNTDFAPEVGHSLATVVNESVRTTARRIVDLMDSPW